MEPLTENKERRAFKKGPDRLTLGKLESEKVDKWLAQINASSKGFLTLTKSDMVNFLIRSYRDELQAKELQKIRSDHYDPLRHMNWISQQLKSVLATNDVYRMSELQAELRGVELSVVNSAVEKTSVIEAGGGSMGAPVPKRKRRQKSELKPIQDEMNSVVRIEDIQGDIPDA